MTALCGGGVSRARPGIVGTAFNTAANITSYLSTFTPLPFAIAVGALAAVETFDVAAYCGQDPPPDPGLTATDMADFLNPADLATWLPAQAKVRQWWRHVYWWQVCECAQVATPPLPPPSNPGGAESGPGLATGQNSPCFETTRGYSATGVSSGTTNTDATLNWLPDSADVISVSFDTGLGTVALRAVKIPSNVTAVYFKTQNGGATTGTGNNAMGAAIEFFTAAGATNGGQQFLTSQSAVVETQPRGIPIPPNSAYWAIPFTNTFDTSVAGKVASWSVLLQFVCTGSTLQTPCCPPDPALELKVNQLLELVINLAQRSPAGGPISWHDGVRHSGLRGAGSFLIDTHAIGIRFEVTTPPQGVRIDPGNPDFYWDMGFWTPYALTSPLRGGRLVFLHQSVELPEFTDQIGFTLKHDTVMDAVELLPTTS